jgi:23S rRNA (cytidine1920-2'-O)/16S rRNA (cytidine1409-2'-O)-methyltransferase
MTPIRRRIDQLLVDLGLAESRHKAQGLLLAGQVLVNEQKVEKPGRMVDPEAAVRILGETPFVSRAGGKLRAALDHFQIAVAGRVCADLGASTGGFTDCLLQGGARTVHAYDVGAGQLDWKLRSDPRVIVHDRYNVRYITAQDLPEEVSLVTADLSFISLTKIFPSLAGALKERLSSTPLAHAGSAFEVGKGEVGKGGIVRDERKQLTALAAVEQAAASAGFAPRGRFRSPVQGARGNQEFLLHLQLIHDLSSKA